MRTVLFAVVTALAVLPAPAPAHAFCGFYVSGAGSEMFNNATQVVLMRKGTRTVLSMQNNYQGPPTDFALVVPVPTVLQKENVKTLPREVFARVDKLGAPRLVEYWERDPCWIEPDYEMRPSGSRVPMPTAAPDTKPNDLGVKVEAKFTVGEYDIVILSAKASTGLDTWLRQEHYQIPAGAEPLLRPYVETNMKFFVAKVDPKKIQFVDGQAMLSPLRFHYDSEDFALPIRLGLANSPGTQDLIVNILAPAGQRYDVDNYPQATIPTNLDVKDEVRTRFGEFYAALFDRTMEKNPTAVITEYAWDASTCDPCPEPALDGAELMTLGADVLGDGPDDFRYGGGFVLTRLHARYSKDGIKDDLVFKEAPPIVGGREHVQTDGKLEERSRPDRVNNFQGRYAIRHEWTKPITCDKPIRGRWSGTPPDGQQIATQAATNLAFVARGAAQLPAMVAEDVPEIDIKAAGAGAVAIKTPDATQPAKPEPAVTDDKKPAAPAATAKQKKSGCGCDAAPPGGEQAGGALLLALAMVLALRARRRSP